MLKNKSVYALVALVLMVMLGAAMAQQPAHGQSDDLLRRRLSIAQREQAQSHRRIAEIRDDVEELKGILEADLYERLLASEINVPQAEEMAVGIALSGSELQAAVERAEAKAKALAEAHATIRARMDAANETIEKARYKLLVAEVARDVVELRGLPLPKPIEPVVLNRKELSELLKKLLDEELPDARMRGETLTWSALGLMPPDADLRLLYSGLLEEQVGGLYNERDGSLYVVETFNPQSIFGKIILSHEICHAVQDQNFPIRELPFRTDNDDQNVAMSAVLEGDATILMIEWGASNFRPSDILGLTEMFNQGTQQLEKVPPALVQALIFPYLVGAQFMSNLKAADFAGWRDLPFTTPPQSTEQILHLDKYYPERESPITVELPDWTETKTLSQAYRGVVGEWVTRLILTRPQDYPKLVMFSTEVFVNEAIAAEAAAGWGGDQIVTVASEDGKQWFTAWKTVWDSEKDAEEFEGALLRRATTWDGFPESVHTHAVSSHGVEHRWVADDERTVWSHRKGVETLVILGSTGELVEQARDWATEQ